MGLCKGPELSYPHALPLSLCALIIQLQIRVVIFRSTGRSGKGSRKRIYVLGLTARGNQGHAKQAEPLEPARGFLPRLPLARKEAKPGILPWSTGLLSTSKQGPPPA